MVYCGEFEFVESDGQVAALPCWTEGATEGATLDDAVTMAADWLRMAALDALAVGERLDCGGFGHAPRMGGRIIAVAIEADKRDIPSMSAADAARAGCVPPQAIIISSSAPASPARSRAGAHRTRVLPAAPAH